MATQASSKRKPAPKTASQTQERFIVFLRHGLAEERGGGKPDEERALTPEGHARMKQIGRGLAAVFPKADAIYTSPLIRCVQTALWVSKAYRGKLKPVTVDALRPGASYEELDAFLNSAEARRPVLIGHEPTLTDHVFKLLGWTGGGDLKKGGCYGVRIGPGGAKLEWILPPKALRKIET